MLLRGASSCRDTDDWRSPWVDSCLDYRVRGWCRNGRILNSTATGSAFGRPEWACCSCGRSIGAALDSSGRPTARAKTLAFVATHHIEGQLDRRLLKHYSQNLAVSGSARLWVMLHQKDHSRPDAALLSSWDVMNTDVWPWNKRSLFDRFPRLGQAVARSTGLRATGTSKGSAYLRLYWFFHAALALWWMGLGHAYPSIEFIWRLEIDVLACSGGAMDLSSLFSRTAALTSADLVLPRVRATSASPMYAAHLVKNMHILKHVPGEKRVWSLVCVGRYSLDFLIRVMQPLWTSGTIGYEEIFLPVSCLADTRCTLASLASPASKARSSAVTYLDVPPAQRVDASHVRFRPSWSCAEARRACRKSGWHGFLHPVKDRACVSDGNVSGRERASQD